MNASPFTGRRWVFCLVLAPVAFLLGLSVQIASPSARDEVRITGAFRDEPLRDVLETLAELAGWSVEVIGASDESRISVTLREATLKESLERILHPRNFAVIWSPENKLTILLIDDKRDAGRASGDLSSQAEGQIDHPISLFPGEEEVLPPVTPGGQGLTIADIEYYRAFDIPSDPIYAEVVPPSSPGTRGVTLEEIDFLSAMRGEEILADMELFPAEGDDGFGLTVAEFEAIKSSRPALAPSQIEVIPPDEPGGIGLTLEQLESTKQAKAFDQPLTVIDPIPPD